MFRWKTHTVQINFDTFLHFSSLILEWICQYHHLCLLLHLHPFSLSPWSFQATNINLLHDWIFYSSVYRNMTCSTRDTHKHSAGVSCLHHLGTCRWWLQFRHDDHNSRDKYFLHLSSVLKITWVLRHQCDLQQSQVHVPVMVIWNLKFQSLTYVGELQVHAD